MKAKRGSKTHKTNHPRKKASGGTRTRAKPITTHPGAVPDNRPTTPVLNSNTKTCQEPEIGDVGGFGSTEELEAHEKRCGQQATEFCPTCSRNLCSSHYELLHRDHDATTRHSTGQGLTHQ